MHKYERTYTVSANVSVFKQCFTRNIVGAGFVVCECESVNKDTSSESHCYKL